MVVEGEDLDVLVGNRPLVEAAATDTDTDAEAAEGTEPEEAAEATGETAGKDPVKAHVLSLLADKYGIAEEDFLSAELEVVPAGRARDLGFDRSMVIGYGQDDRVCAYTSLAAQLALGDDVPARTAVCVLVDKEEIGSVGASGMASMFFENTIAEIMALAGEDGPLALRRALTRSRMLSSDVSAGFDPAYASVYEAKNSAYLGRGLVFNKYTGARGKSGSNDASAEYVALVRRIMDDAHVSFQTADTLEYHRFGRSRALHARPLGSDEQGRHLRGPSRLRGLPARRVVRARPPRITRRRPLRIQQPRLCRRAPPQGALLGFIS